MNPQTDSAFIKDALERCIETTEQTFAETKFRKVRAEAIIVELKAADALNEYVFSDSADGNLMQQASLIGLIRVPLKSIEL